jgi:hypothetical protein
MTASKVFKGAYQAAKFAMMVCLCLFLIVGIQTLREIKKAATATVELAEESKKRVEHTSQNLNAILIQAGLASDEARRASIEQRQYLKTLNRQVSQDLVQFHRVLVAAEKTINKVGQESELTVAALRPVLVQTESTLAEAQNTLEQLTKTTANLATTTGDPNIPKIIAHTEKTTDNLAAASVDVKESTGMLKEKVKDITKPANWWKRVGLYLAQAAAAVKQVVF